MGAMLVIGLGGKPKKGTNYMNPMEAFLGGGDKKAKEPLIEDEASSDKSGKIYFNKPAGFKVPDGIKDGESFDAMASMKFENGKLCLHEIDGTPVDDEPEGEEMPEEGSDEEESQETPEEESTEDESAEPASEEDSEEEPEGEEPKDFLDAVEKKSSKSDKEKEDKKKKGNPFAK